MNKSNYQRNIELFIRMERCIHGGTLQDHIRIMDDLKDLTMDEPTYYGFMTALPIQVKTPNLIISNYITSFAAAFPDAFRRYDYTIFTNHIRAAVVGEIMAHAPAAYVMADVILKDEAVLSDSIFSEMLLTAAICGNDKFFEYAAGLVKEPYTHINDELVFYLYENKKYDLLDMIFTNASRKDILRLSNVTSIQVSFSPINKLQIMYDLAVRYLPEVRESDNIPSAASEFLDEADIMSYLVFQGHHFGCLNIDKNIDDWNFMKEHGLKFRHISYLALNRYYNSAEDRRLFMEYIMPLLDDEVYIDAFILTEMQLPDQKALAEYIKIIGADRVYLDFTNAHNPTDNPGLMAVSRLKPIAILKTGVNVRIDDDIANCCAAMLLINNPVTLEYVLNRIELSDDQINDLIDMCINNKGLESLNVIRQYKNSIA